MKTGEAVSRALRYSSLLALSQALALGERIREGLK